MILLENAEFLVVDKPSGVSSQDDETDGESLLSLYPHTYVITRLDKRVSGLVLLAKNKESAAQLTALLVAGDLEKKYSCVVAQKPDEENAVLKNWLKKVGVKSKVYSQPTEGAKEASLEYSLVGSSERYFLLDIKIHTGRFHQIRSQLAAHGMPIVGDLKYGFKRNSKDGSIFLTCTQMGFKWKGNLVSVQTGIPDLWKRYGF